MEQSINNPNLHDELENYEQSFKKYGCFCAGIAFVLMVAMVTIGIIILCGIIF